jgi:hypothetical protein
MSLNEQAGEYTLDLYIRMELCFEFIFAKFRPPPANANPKVACSGRYDTQVARESLICEIDSESPRILVVK